MHTERLTKGWEIASYSGGKEILKETGPMGRFIFGLEEYPGLSIDAARFRAMMVAAPQMSEALKAACAALAGTLQARGYETDSDISEWAPEVREELRALVAVRSALAVAGEPRS